MKKELQKKTDLFLENRRILREAEKLESEKNYLFGAMMFADENKEVNAKNIEKCNKILKENTSFFSDFRTFSFPVIVKMALHKKPEEYLKLLQKNYSVLSKKSVFGSYYKFLTAMIVSDYEKNIRAESLSAREKKIYGIGRTFNHRYAKNKSKSELNCR